MNCKDLIICCAAVLYLLSSCIVPFEPQGMKQEEGILVVEGMIMDTGTTIKLTRTISLYADDPDSTRIDWVYGARVQVIDDRNNVVAVAEPQSKDGTPGIVYAVPGEIAFTPGTKYALSIQIGEKRYQSAFVSPTLTPEIDEISWRTNTDGSMDIMVSTHDPENQTEYYRWAFEEDWEIRSYLFGFYWYNPITGEVVEQSPFTSNNRYYCWASDKSKAIILGTSGRLTEATIKNNVIHSIPTYNSRFSYLYSILVRQYGIDKETYIYYKNLKDNIELSGSLFAPLLTEIKGNIACLSNPDEPVVGYISATNEVKTRIFIDMLEIGGEDLYACEEKESRRFSRSQLASIYIYGYSIVTYMDAYFICYPIRCVDCTARGGTKNKPDFWPNDHQ